NPVDQLFARIRAGKDEPPPPVEPTPHNGVSNGHGPVLSEEDQADTDAPPEVGQGPRLPEEPGVGAPGGLDVTEEPGVGAAGGSDVTEGLLQRREGQLVDLETGLTRKLKRALQDEQNDLLDRLRGLRGEPTAEALLPDLESHTARYVKASTPSMEQAASAGAVFAGEVLRSAPGGNESGEVALDVPVDVADLAAEAASAIVGPLRRRLEQVITSGAGEEQSVLVESLGAAYREWKSQRIERMAGDVLAAAFSRGTWNAAPEGISFRWVVEDADGPCPDCDDDALAGDLPKGESFPTGQPYPPAHSGCRCLLVPVAG
ncbi:MAG TPA: hypothetical protein VMO88_08325, partial [Acidimicrobiales bacterium]|nr:hypothetical protein [Acidimicrobiales bacterium]